MLAVVGGDITPETDIGITDYTDLTDNKYFMEWSSHLEWRHKRHSGKVSIISVIRGSFSHGYSLTSDSGMTERTNHGRRRGIPDLVVMLF